jgi:predicted dehydrogenase
VPDDIHVAIIGAGRHGRDLINYCLDIPGVRFRAVCDIWPYAQKYAAGILKKRGQPVAVYEDYREALAKEKDLQAAIVATPDAFHAEQAVACLQAHLHVYCEKEMALTVEDCRRMVRAARAGGRLLQVGRQHRSNPRYMLALNYIYEKKALGRVTNVGGQWHGHRRVKFTWPDKFALDGAALKRYGYESMEQFRNWRWFARFSAGELVNLGAHQLDVFNWFLRATPRAVTASGGLDYYDFYELHDNATCLLEWDFTWEGKTRTVRGVYDVNTTTEDGGFYETFYGRQGALSVSEDAAKGGIWREPFTAAASWEAELPKPVIQACPEGLSGYGMSDGIDEAERRGAGGRIYPPIPSPGIEKQPHWYHLNNFFCTIRGQATLNCPAEVGFQGAVTALRAVEAMKAGRRLEFKPEDFGV